MLEGFRSHALRQLDVTIAGEWRSGRYRDWHGEVRSGEPIVAIVFCRCSGVISWCKSERPRPGAQSIRLLLGPYDSAGRDVQVNFSIGDGHVVSRTMVPSITYYPPLPGTLSLSTATLSPIATVVGSRDVELFALFLAGTDTKVGRNGLWHLRSNLIDSVPEAYRPLLSRGRTGELAAA